MPMQEFLASYAVEVDESGAKKLQEILKTNRELAESLAGAFDAARTALNSLDASMDDLDVRAVLNEKLQLSDLPVLDLKAELDLTEATDSAETWIAQLEALRPKLKANTSGITTAVSSAVSSIRSMLSSLSITVPVRAVVTLDTSGLPDGGSDGDAGGERGGSGGITIPAFANGGRVDSPTMAMIGEESEPEYVIPVNREERAVPLVRDLLSEMSEPAKESVLGMEKTIPEKEALSNEEPIPHVKEFFSSPESVPQVTEVFPETEQVQPVEDIPAESEVILPAVESVPGTEPVPLVHESLPETKPIPQITELLLETEKIPPAQEMTLESEAVPPVRESLPELDTVPPVRESLHEPEMVLPEKESQPDAKPLQDVKAFLPETEVILPVKESVSVPEEPLPFTEGTIKQTLPVSGKETIDRQAVPAVSIMETLPDYPASVSVREALSEQSAPVPLSEKPSGKQHRPVKALSHLTFGKTNPADTPADDLAIPVRVSEQITSSKVTVPDKAQPGSSPESIPQLSVITETTKSVFPEITGSVPNVDLSLLQDAITDLGRMILPQAPDASFISSMLHDLTEIARSQFLPAGVSAPAPSHSVEAPVTIQVNSPYASPEEVGRSVYDLTQRYLLRTMKGVFA